MPSLTVKTRSNRGVAQLVAFLVWDQAVARSSRVAPTIIKRTDSHCMTTSPLFLASNSPTLRNQNIRMKKDSLIWTTVSLPLGLEIARFKMSNDSVFFMNRTEKTYFMENIQVLNDISPMITSFDLIQSVLIGNDINLRESDSYKVEINNDEYNLLITNKLKKSIKHKDDDWKVVMKDICIDPQLYKITKYYIKEYNNSKRKIDVQYSDFQKVNDKYVPTKIMIQIHGDLNLKVNITYSNISVDNDLEYMFNIPKKYDRIFK